ncbi:MAG: branched-chain amino acid permease [Acidimicrobiales bacterium]|nr:branched-chain amino acid permease [Acidimicrobiales bacterium]
MLSLLDRQAIRDGFPLLLPAIPFGFVLGLAMSESAMPIGVAYSSSLFLYAGAAQLALVTLVGAASAWAVAVAVMVINLRHVMYSAAMAPSFEEQPRWFRILAPMFLIDQVFALTSLHTDLEPERFRRYYLTLAAMFYSAWQVLSVLGILFGALVPTSWGLGFAPALMFAGIVVMMLTNRPAVIAAVVAAAVCFATLGLPNRSGLLVGALAGISAGFLAESRSR